MGEPEEELNGFIKKKEELLLHNTISFAWGRLLMTSHIFCGLVTPISISNVSKSCLYCILHNYGLCLVANSEIKLHISNRYTNASILFGITPIYIMSI